MKSLKDKLEKAGNAFRKAQGDWKSELGNKDQFERAQKKRMAKKMKLLK